MNEILGERANHFRVETLDLLIFKLLWIIIYLISFGIIFRQTDVHFCDADFVFQVDNNFQNMYRANYVVIVFINWVVAVCLKKSSLLFFIWIN